MEVVLNMLFLTFCKANLLFVEKKVIWKTYTTEKALPIIRWVEFINSKDLQK